MSILSTIMSKIMAPGHAKPAAPAAPRPAAPTRATVPASAPAAAPAAAPKAAATPMSAVDVEANLEAMAKSSGQKLNWRTSIVDLMKLLDIDPDMTNRRALASELGYTGDMNDSATMNVWLHKQVMQNIAQNGGKVPASMMD